MSRYRFVSTMKAEGFPVAAACEVAEVSTSAYYDCAAKVRSGPSAVEWVEALVVNETRDVHAHHDGTYGSPRMTTELRRRGFCLNHKRTERLMAENGIVAADGRRKKVRTTIPYVTAPPLPDLVRRDLSVGEPGRRANQPAARCRCRIPSEASPSLLDRERLLAGAQRACRSTTSRRAVVMEDHGAHFAAARLCRHVDRVPAQLPGHALAHRPSPIAQPISRRLPRSSTEAR